MKFRHLTHALILGISLIGTVAVAEDPTPTPTATPEATATPAATPTPTACQSLQGCVDTSVPAAVASCASSNPLCTAENTDKFAASAGDLASRSVAAAKCSKAKQKFSCNACYQRAKEPLRIRFDGKIFHGLLAQAISIIEAERKVTCLALDNKKGGHGRK